MLKRRKRPTAINELLRIRKTQASLQKKTAKFLGIGKKITPKGLLKKVSVGKRPKEITKMARLVKSMKRKPIGRMRKIEDARPSKIVSLPRPYHGRRYTIISLKYKDDVIIDEHNKYNIGWLIKLLYMDLYMYVRLMINIFTPKETGDLRESLIESINPKNNTVESDGIEMKISTDIYYAKYVMEMDTATVRHFGEKMGKRSKRPLYDPLAVGNFFSILRNNVRNRIKNHYLPRFKNNIRRYINISDFNEIFEMKI